MLGLRTSTTLHLNGITESRFHNHQSVSVARFDASSA